MPGIMVLRIHEIGRGEYTVCPACQRETLLITGIKRSGPMVGPMPGDAWVRGECRPCKAVVDIQLNDGSVA